MPDLGWIHRELARPSVTLTLLWGEYCVEVRNDGGISSMYTQFCEKYRQWARVTTVKPHMLLGLLFSIALPFI